MATISVRSKGPEDDEYVVGLRNRLSDHLPPSSVESFRHWERVDALSTTSHTERFVAERGGDPVGILTLEKMWWTERPGGYFLALAVDPEAWNRGIGGEMYEYATERLGQLGALRIYSNVRNDRPNAQAFADHRGFEKTGHADRWSRLEVASANLTGYEGVEDRLAESGIVIKTLAESGESEELLRRLHQLNDEAVRDIPMSETFTESPYEMFIEELRGPDMSPEQVWIAFDGETPAGIAILPIRGSKGAFNGFTGVARAYRGKGVARALKYRTVQWAGERGIEYVYTANDVNNERMLAINNSLGYEELPIGIEVAKDLAPHGESLDSSA